MEAVCEKILDGFGEQMRAVSLQFVPTASLSRGTDEAVLKAFRPRHARKPPA